jgi:hypothetical protein
VPRTWKEIEIMTKDQALSEKFRGRWPDEYAAIPEPFWLIDRHLPQADW